MTLLIIGIAAFLSLHVVPTFPDLRERLVARLGEGPYKGLFALLSVASFILLVYGFAKAPLIQLWSPPSWTRWVAIVLMLPAFIFLVAGYVPGQIKAKLKHPFLVAIKTWALAHLIANGDLASIVLFGSFLACRVRPHHPQAPHGDRTRDGAGDRTAVKRRHRRRPRTRALSRLLVLAARAPDRDVTVAAVMERERSDGIFCTAKYPIFCHKTPSGVRASSGA